MSVEEFDDCCELYKKLTYALGGSTAGLLVLVCILCTTVSMLCVKVRKYRQQQHEKRTRGPSAPGNHIHAHLHAHSTHTVAQRSH